MRFSEFMFLFVKSLNPGDYRMLITRKKRDTISYFLMLLLFAIVIGVVFSIPKLTQVPNKIETTLMKFERFNITGIDVQAKEKIVLSGFPKVAVDLSGNEANITDEYILITKSDVYLKKFRPSILEFRLFEVQDRKVTEYGDVISSFSKISGGTYTILFLLFLPTILILTFVFDLIKYSAIIFIFTLVAFLIAKLKGRKVRLSAVWRTAVFSSTLMVVTEVTVFQLFDYSLVMALIPIVIYFVTFLLSMLVILEKDIQIKQAEE